MPLTQNAPLECGCCGLGATLMTRPSATVTSEPQHTEHSQQVLGNAPSGVAGVNCIFFFFGGNNEAYCATSYTAHYAAHRPLMRPTLIRPRHAEHMLGHEGEDQIGRDRGDLVQPGLAPLALDIVLLGIAEAAVGLERGLRGVPRRFR